MQKVKIGEVLASLGFIALFRDSMKDQNSFDSLMKRLRTQVAEMYQTIPEKLPSAEVTVEPYDEITPGVASVWADFLELAEKEGITLL